MSTKKDILLVSECFYSIQGEGQTMGVPAVFLRLGGCNLLCKSDSWVCDTIEVWQKSKATQFKDVLSSEHVNALQNGAHLVITGGEPLMHQQAIYNYLGWFYLEYGIELIVEVETNGTIMPTIELLDIVSFWNVSPKLANAGEQNSKSQRINGQALQCFSLQKEKTIFKFVVSNAEDILEVWENYLNADKDTLGFGLINKNQIVLMPAGSSQEELQETRLFVAEQCREFHFRYSERLHVVIWNLKTGV